MHLNILALKLLFAVLILMITVLAGIYPFRVNDGENAKYDFPLGESLSCGVFLGVSLLHMLNESSRTFQEDGIHYPLAYLIAGGVFLAYLWLEHLGRELHHKHKNNNIYFAIIAMVMMSIHSVLAGAALGLSEDLSVSVMLFIAIIAHKWAESFSISVHLNKSGIKKKNAYLLYLLFTSMTPLGIILGSSIISFLSAKTLLIPIFSSLAGGTFLYLGTLHGLEKCVLVKQCCNLRYFSYVILGFTIMAAIAIYV